MTESSECHRHRYEFNNDYRETLIDRRRACRKNGALKILTITQPPRRKP